MLENTPLSDRQLELVSSAITMYANWLQTGDPLLAVADLERQGRKNNVKSPGEEQMRLLLELAALRNRFDSAITARFYGNLPKKSDEAPGKA